MSKLTRPSINIYCDESRVENKQYKYMLIGGIILPREKRDEIYHFLDCAWEKHGFRGELKWSHCNKRFEGFYRDLIDLFVSSKDLNFRCIIIDKNELKIPTGGEEEELRFYKFYYYMLNKIPEINKGKDLYVFLDKKPINDKSLIPKLTASIRASIFKHKTEGELIHLGTYSSDENKLLQMADFILGAVGFNVNTQRNNSLKDRLSVYLKEKAGKKELLESSQLYEQKFNIFVWKAGFEKKY